MAAQVFFAIEGNHPPLDGPGAALRLLMTPDRPYRPRMADAEALQILSDRRGTMYDPRVVDAFLSLHGISTASAPPPARERPSAVQAPLRTGDDYRELDLQMFFEFRKAIGTPTSMSELGEIVWGLFKTRLPASTFVSYGYDRADDSIVAVYEEAWNAVPCTRPAFHSAND